MNLVLDTTLEFYQKTVDHTNDRFLSFDHCYKHFQNLKQPPKNEQLEISMLHLGFYLASWGMYRGSSFLLQKDYTIYAPIVSKVLDSKYQCLRTLDTTMNSGNLMKWLLFLSRYTRNSRVNSRKQERNTIPKEVYPERTYFKCSYNQGNVGNLGLCTGL